MLINFNHLQTFYSALKQKFKSMRGNWEQNNPEADDYIKNRPFYTEIGESVILPEGTYISDDRGGNFGIELNTPLVNGKIYTVTCNGVSYQCLAKEYDGYIILGNHYIYRYDDGNETDTGEPFAIEAEEGFLDGAVYTGEYSAEYKLSISTYGEIVHQIDKKYVPIPDDIVTSDELYDELDGMWNAVDNSINIVNDNINTLSQRTVQIFPQSFNNAQKQMARTNIGAGTSNFSGSYNDLSDKPEQVQVNWSDFDSSSIAYIKNKPFGYEYELEVNEKFHDFVSSNQSNQLVAGTLNNDTGLYESYPGLNATVFNNNQLYCFFVNDTQVFSTCKTYQVSALNTQKISCVGNAQLGVQAGQFSNTSNYPVEDTGEDWCIINRGAVSSSFYTTNPDIKITKCYKVISESLKQLDEKYIPNTIVRVSDIQSATNDEIDALFQ